MTLALPPLIPFWWQLFTVDSNVILYPFDGYGNPDFVRYLIKTEKPDKKFTPEEIEAKLNQLYPGRAERKKDTPEESKLREVIREMINSELEEATQLSTIITPKTSDKEREERDPQQFITTYLAAPTEELMKKNQHLRILRDPQNPEEIKGVAIRSRFIAPQNLKKLPYDINPMFINFLNTANNIGGEISLPTKEGVMDTYTVLNNVNIGRDGRLSFKTPNPKFEKLFFFPSHPITVYFLSKLIGYFQLIA